MEAKKIFDKIKKDFNGVRLSVDLNQFNNDKINKLVELLNEDDFEIDFQDNDTLIIYK